MALLSESAVGDSCGDREQVQGCWLSHLARIIKIQKHADKRFKVALN